MTTVRRGSATSRLSAMSHRQRPGRNDRAGTTPRRRCPSQKECSPRRLRQRGRHLGHSINDQIVGGGDHGILRAHRREHEESQCEQKVGPIHLSCPPHHECRILCIHHQCRDREHLFEPAKLAQHRCGEVTPWMEIGPSLPSLDAGLLSLPRPCYPLRLNSVVRAFHATSKVCRRLHALASSRGGHARAK